MKQATFKKLQEINEAINVLAEYPLLSDDRQMDLLVSALKLEGHTYEDWVEANEAEIFSTPLDLFYLAKDMYENEMAGTEPYMANELVIATLLHSGMSSSDAHSILCTISTLYDYGISIEQTK